MKPPGGAGGVPAPSNPCEVRPSDSSLLRRASYQRPDCPGPIRVGLAFRADLWSLVNYTLRPVEIAGKERPGATSRCRSAGKSLA